MDSPDIDVRSSLVSSRRDGSTRRDAAGASLTQKNACQD